MNEVKTYVLYPNEYGILNCIDEKMEPVIGDQLGAGVTQFVMDLAEAARLTARVTGSVGAYQQEDLYGTIYKVGWFRSLEDFRDTVKAELDATEGGG